MKDFPGYTLIAGTTSAHPEKYGVLIEEDGFLKRIIEKPAVPPSNLVNIGLYRFTSEVFKALDKITLSERGEYELTDALTLLAAQKKVRVILTEETWFDLGSPEDIKKVEAFFTQNKISAN